MANALYTAAKTAFLNAGINLGTATIRAALVSGYTPNLATDQYFSTIPGASVLCQTAAGGLTGKSVTAGAFSAANDTFVSVPATGTGTAIVIYADTGTATTSQLIAYLDTGSAGAISQACTGTNIPVAWDTGANKIFKLA